MVMLIKRRLKNSIKKSNLFKFFLHPFLVLKILLILNQETIIKVLHILNQLNL